MSEPTERDHEVTDSIVRTLDTWEPGSEAEALRAIVAYREECAKAERSLIRADIEALAEAWKRGDNVAVSGLLVKLLA